MISSTLVNSGTTFQAYRRCQTSRAPLQDKTSQVFIPIYKFPNMRAVRFVSRLKIYQTAFTVVLLGPMTYFHSTGEVTSQTFASCTAVSALACVMLYVMSNYFARLVGLMSISEDLQTVRLSHLTFWGKRNDVFTPTENVMPISDMGERADEIYLRLRRFDSKDTLLFTIKYGQILDPEKFKLVFGDIK